MEKNFENDTDTLDRDVEALLRSAAFSNPVHKDALRQRLFGDGAELELDDLALAAGGLAEPLVPPEAWTDAWHES